MGGVEAVFTSGTGDEAVVTSVVAAVLIAELAEFPVALVPVDFVVFAFGDETGITDALFVEIDGGFFAVFGVFEFDGGVWSLVADDAACAEPHLRRKAVPRFELVCRMLVQRFVDGSSLGIRFH